MFDEWLRGWVRMMFPWLTDKRETDEKGGPATSAPTPPRPKPEVPAERPETSKPAPEQAPAGASVATAADADDLTAIKGIGPAIQKKLNALGIRTFADLATADPEEVAAKLDQRTLTAQRIRDWSEEAGKRSGK